MEQYDHSQRRYRDREEAGKVLSSRFSKYNSRDLIVLAIPNGGVSVAAVIAEELNVELYLMIVRKLQIPDNPEAGFGALTSDGLLLLNEPLLARLGLSEEDISAQKAKALESIRSRQKLFGKRAVTPPLKGKTVILVDDGLASGFTMEAAVQSVRTREAGRIIIAVPTSSMSAHRRLEARVDEIICPDLSRLRIFAVANAYQNWYDVEEPEVLTILEHLQEPRHD